MSHRRDPMSTHTMPSAEIVFDTLFAYQRSAALNSAIDLDMFTAIDEGARTPAALASPPSASSPATLKGLDSAAGHGLFGTPTAQPSARAEIVAVDGKAVLAVAEGHARAAPVHDRYRTGAGDAFATDLGTGYDVAL